MITRISKKRAVGVVNLTIKESFADALIKNTTLEIRDEDGIGGILGRSVLLRNDGSSHGDRIELLKISSPVIERAFLDFRA